VALKAWHIYALLLPLMVILFIGVTYGANERDGSERTVEATPLPEDGEGEGGPGPGPGPGGPPTIVAVDISFDPDTLTVPAGQEFTLILDNQDAGIPHNVEIEDVGFSGEIFEGVATMEYTVPALEPGDYEFICVVHPAQMTGTMTAEEGAGPPAEGGEPPAGPDGPPPLQIEAEDNSFSNEELRAPADQEVTLELANNGDSLHNWVIPDEDVTMELVPGGETGTTTFTLAAGEYEYICEVHPQEMTGVLLVE
jgi:plastocyanin